MVHFAGLAGLDDKADRGAQALADQMMMHRRASEQRRNLNAVDTGAAIRQDDDVDAVAHRGVGFAAQRGDRRLHAGGAGLGRPGGVQRARLEVIAHVGDGADFFQVGIGEDRLPDFQALELRQAFQIEQVRPRPDDRDEAHDQFFADRIDRRIGHLGEVLFEISEQQLRPVRQRRDRRIVAHGADRFFAGRRHRRHQDFEIFLGVAEGLLAIEQRQVRDRCRFRDRRQFFQHHLGAVEPLRDKDGSWRASP